MGKIRPPRSRLRATRGIHENTRGIESQGVVLGRGQAGRLSYGPAIAVPNRIAIPGLSGPKKIETAKRTRGSAGAPGPALFMIFMAFMASVERMLPSQEPRDGGRGAPALPSHVRLRWPPRKKRRYVRVVSRVFSRKAGAFVNLGALGALERFTDFCGWASLLWLFFTDRTLANRPEFTR